MRLPWNRSKDAQLDLLDEEPASTAPHPPPWLGPGKSLVQHVSKNGAPAVLESGRHDGRPMLVAVTLLYEDANNPRTEFPEDSLAELAADIQQRGVLQPLVVHSADGDGRHRIHFGAKRLRAAIRAGLDEVPVVVRDLPADRYAQVAENQMRHGLTPIELASFIRAQVNAGDSNATVAKQLGMNLTAVAHHLSLLELPPVLDDALKSGRCTSPRTLHELSKLHAKSPGQGDRLRKIDEHARLNGVSDLVWLSAEAACELEPALSCTGALFSPSSGIVDSHELMTALLADAEAGGALLAVASTFVGASPVGSAWVARTDGEAAYELETDWIVNCAGLFAHKVAGSIESFPQGHIPERWLAKGHYFSLAGRSPFARLVYPLPADGGLGVHCTVDLGGQAKFGPDVEWLPKGTDPAAIDYAVDERRVDAFYGEIRRYWPELREGALSPAYSGVRPKLSGPGQNALDFHIDGPSVHGCRGVVQLFGIESPGLTASMAIAERVAAIVGGTATER
jgi:ParB/RepB/Spo0J family partition protein